MIITHTYGFTNSPQDLEPASTVGFDTLRPDNVDDPNAKGNRPIFVAFFAGQVKEAAAILRMNPELNCVISPNRVLSLFDLVDGHYDAGRINIGAELSSLLKKHGLHYEPPPDRSVLQARSLLRASNGVQLMQG